MTSPTVAQVQNSVVQPAPQRKPRTKSGRRPAGVVKSAAKGARRGASGAALGAGRAAGRAVAGAPRSALRAATSSGPRRVLVAEFVVCALVAGLSPLTDKHATDTPTQFIKRLSAIALLFIFLGVASTGGPGAAKVSAGFGGLVMLSLLLSNRDVFTVIAQRFSEPPPEGPGGPGGAEDNTPTGPTAGAGSAQAGKGR